MILSRRSLLRGLGALGAAVATAWHLPALARRPEPALDSVALQALLDGETVIDTNGAPLSALQPDGSIVLSHLRFSVDQPANIRRAATEGRDVTIEHCSFISARKRQVDEPLLDLRAMHSAGIKVAVLSNYGDCNGGHFVRLGQYPNEFVGNFQKHVGEAAWKPMTIVRT